MAGFQQQAGRFSARSMTERGVNSFAGTQGEAQRRTSPDFQSSSAPGYCLHSANGCRVAHAAQGTGVWQRCQLLAQIARLDGVGRLGSSPQPSPECAQQSGPDRSFADRHRQPIGARRFWGAHTGPNPTDRAKNGCKRHVVTEAHGLPLAVQVGPANVHDSQPALNLLDQIPPIQGARGRPRHRPNVFLGDAAYGTPTNIAGTRQRGVESLLAVPRREHGSGLGQLRYVVERTHTWFGFNRRLKLCYEKTEAHFQAFHDLAAALICARRLHNLN